MKDLKQSHRPALEPLELRAFEDRSEASDHSTWEAANLLWQRRRRIGRVGLIALLVATLVAFVIPRRYTSATRIMPPDNSGAMATAMLSAITGKAGAGFASYAGEMMGIKTTGALFVTLLRSRSVEDRLIDRFDLRKVYRDRYWEDARDDLRSYTDISEDRKSGVITIRVTDKDRRRAAAMADAYVQELNRLLAQVSTSSARQERMFIEQRLETVKDNLEKAEKAFSIFASKNTALDIKEQTRAMVSSAAELEGQLIAAQSQLQGLEQIYTGNNVRVRVLRARVAELQQQLQKINGTDASLQGENGKDDSYPSIRKLPLLGVEWASLYREAKMQETVYELLTREYELARIQEAKEVSVVRVADPANIPEKKSFPPRLLIMLGVTLLAIIATSMVIVNLAKVEALEANDPAKVLVMGAMSAVRQSWWNAGTRHRWIRSASHSPRNGSDNSH